MIYEGSMDLGTHLEKRAVVECDKPGCPESTYMPGAGMYTAAERMRLVGWEVPQELTRGTPETGGQVVHGYAARCPTHAQAAPVAHTHMWQATASVVIRCRVCGKRRD